MAAPTVGRGVISEQDAWDRSDLTKTLAEYFGGRDPEPTFSEGKAPFG